MKVVSQRLMKKVLFIVFLVASAFSGFSVAAALAVGLVFALVTGGVYPSFSKKASRILLLAAVVGIGFGINFNSAIRSGGAGMAMTIVSVVFVMIAGWVLGRMMRVDGKVSYLVSAGTAICGGSAIAAVTPVVKEDDSQISVSPGTIFTLNALALLIFPPIGRMLGLTEILFGEWAAIAIHETSSVVGAGAAYGSEAMQTATLIKCTRALWILPLAFATTLIMREKGAKVSVPWFIVFSVLAMIINILMPQSEVWMACTKVVVALSKQAMCVTLFLIGSMLSLSSLRRVGARSLLQGVALWVLTAAVSLLIVLH